MVLGIFCTPAVIWIWIKVAGSMGRIVTNITWTIGALLQLRIHQFQSSIDLNPVCMINRCAVTVWKYAALLQRIAPKSENKLKSIRRSRDWRASGVTRVYVVPFWRRHSLDGIVNKLRIDDGGTTVWFQAGTRLFLFSETFRPTLEAHPAFYQCVPWAFFLIEGKGEQLGLRADHSLPFSAEVKTEWSYTSYFQIYFYSVHRENFTRIVCVDQATFGVLLYWWFVLFLG